MKLKWFKSYKLIYGDSYNSVTTDGQIFTKSTFTIFAHLHIKLTNMLIAETTAEKCSSKETFCKYVANLQENTHAKRRF